MNSHYGEYLQRCKTVNESYSMMCLEFDQSRVMDSEPSPTLAC